MVKDDNQSEKAGNRGNHQQSIIVMEERGDGGGLGPGANTLLVEYESKGNGCKKRNRQGGGGLTSQTWRRVRKHCVRKILLRREKTKSKRAIRMRRKDLKMSKISTSRTDRGGSPNSD